MQADIIHRLKEECDRTVRLRVRSYLRRKNTLGTYKNNADKVLGLVVSPDFAEVVEAPLNGGRDVRPRRAAVFGEHIGRESLIGAGGNRGGGRQADRHGQKKGRFGQPGGARQRRFRDAQEIVHFGQGCVSPGDVSR